MGEGREANVSPLSFSRDSLRFFHGLFFHRLLFEDSLLELLSFLAILITFHKLYQLMLKLSSEDSLQMFSSSLGMLRDS